MFPSKIHVPLNRSLRAFLALWACGFVRIASSQADVLCQFEGEGKVEGRVIFEKPVPSATLAAGLEGVADLKKYGKVYGLKTDGMCEVAVPEWGEGDPRMGIASDGFVGACWDGRGFEDKQRGFAPAFGSFQRDVEPSGLAKMLSEARCFAITFWLCPSAEKATGERQGRLVKTPLFQINYRGDFIEMGLAKPHVWMSSGRFMAWGNPREWSFCAVTLRCSGRKVEISMYGGGENTPLVFLGSHEAMLPTEMDDLNMRWIVFGNSEWNGNRPFRGRLDEMRVGMSKDFSSTIAGREALEKVRRDNLKLAAVHKAATMPMKNLQVIK